MNKNNYWLIGGVLLAALILLTFLAPQNNSGEMQKVWRGWPGVAAFRPYALAQDFLQAHGIALKVEDHPRGSFPPDDADALLLKTSDNALSETQRERLHDWVEAGGLLILEADHAAGETFGIKWQTLDPAEEGYRWQQLQIKTPVRRHIEYRGAGKTYKSASGKTLALDITVGRGRVVALAHDFTLWANRDRYITPNTPAADAPVPLAQGDNAAYLHSLLQERKQALLVEDGIPGGDRPPWQWKLPSAQWWPLIASAALLLIAFLYYSGRRFGTLLQPAAGNAGNIARHLQAAGGYWAGERDGYAYLCEQVRQRLAADLASKQRYYPDRAAQLADLAARSGMNVAAIEALLDTTPHDENSFIDHMNTIEQLRRTL